MKKISFLLFFLFCFIFECSFAQYGRWALDAEAGIHRVNDASAISYGNPTHLGLGLRYNFNPKVGLGLTLGNDFGKIQDFDLNVFNFNYYRANLEGYVNILNVLDLNNNFFTLIAHGGPGFSRIETTNNDYGENVFNFSSGISGLIHIFPKLALKVDYSTISHIKQKKTMDGSYPSENVGVNSTVKNYSAGLVFYFGIKNGKKRHADWYVAPPIKIPEPKSVINNYYKSDSIYIDKTSKCDCKKDELTFRRFVFFNHDKWDVLDDGLDQIYDMLLRLREKPGYVLVIKAWASPTNSSDEYNLELSKKRCQAIYDKYIALGVDPSQLKMDWFGKDKSLDQKIVHDIARRVEIYLEKR